jgi:hypothetical protein
VGGQPPGPIGRTRNPIIDSGTMCRNQSSPPVPQRGQYRMVMEVILVARSIGKRRYTDQLSQEGHAGLIFNLGQHGINDHWIAQAGPSNGYLIGSVRHCPSHGWYQEFSMARGAIWDNPTETTMLPITVLMQISIALLTSAQLISISDNLNRKRLNYIYETGPNSNTWVRMFLERIGIPLVAPSKSGIILKGWSWR